MTVTEAPAANLIDTQFSTREVPWMKLGKLVTETKKAAEAAEVAGLNFTVSLRDITYVHDGQPMQPKNRKAIVRDDTGELFDVVSADVYQTLQYGEAFDFMDTVDSQYVAAGALRGGRQGFLVVKAPFQLDMGPLTLDDPHDLYAVLRTSHDRSRGIEVAVMPLRHRCMNQLTLSSFTKDVPHRWSIKHSHNMKLKLAEAQDSLAKLTNYAGRFAALAQRLLDVKVDDAKANTVLKAVIPARAKQVDVITKIITLQDAEQVGFKGTGWGLLNAVSEYYDWSRAGGTAESRFLGALEGQSTKAINKTVVHLLRVS